MWVIIWLLNLLPSILLGMFFHLQFILAFAAIDPLVGTWKTIDDRTGYSLADVVIRKDKHDLYRSPLSKPKRTREQQIFDMYAMHRCSEK